MPHWYADGTQISLRSFRELIQAEFPDAEIVLFERRSRERFVTALKRKLSVRPQLGSAETKLYMTLGALIPIRSRLWISARRTTAAVASRKRFLASSVSVRMWCLW